MNTHEHSRKLTNTYEHSRTLTNTYEHSRTLTNTNEHSRTLTNTHEHSRKPSKTERIPIKKHNPYFKTFKIKRIKNHEIAQHLKTQKCPNPEWRTRCRRRTSTFSSMTPSWKPSVQATLRFPPGVSCRTCRS